MKVGDLVRLRERFSSTEGPDRLAVIVKMIHRDVARICFSDNSQTISVWTKLLVHAA